MKTNSIHKINLGLLGASQIANKIVPSIKKVKAIQIAGVAAQDEKRAKAFQKKHHLAKTYTDYAACLTDPTVNAVYISVLSCDHAGLIEKSLRAGKHVLCEKPLVLTPRDAKRLFKLAKSRRLILLEGLMYRFHPQIQKIKRAVAQGRLGRIKSIKVGFSFLMYGPDDKRARATAKAGGGALFDLGCYAVDFVNMFAGSSKISKLKVIKQLNGKKLLEHFVAIIEFANGVTASIECSTNSPSINNWEVRGTKGAASALRFDPQGTANTPVYFIDDESRGQLTSVPAIDTFAAEFENFAAAITKGSAPHIPAAQSIANSVLLEKILKAGE